MEATPLQFNFSTTGPGTTPSGPEPAVQTEIAKKMIVYDIDNEYVLSFAPRPLVISIRHVQSMYMADCNDSARLSTRFPARLVSGGIPRIQVFLSVVQAYYLMSLYHSCSFKLCL